jgi:thioredoxin reductase (NADPH)
MSGGEASAYDIVVLGGGLAGLTAGLFGARQGHPTLVLESGVPGGHLVNVQSVEDFPGFSAGVAGVELCPVTQEQAANAGAEFAMAHAQALRPSEPGWVIETSEGAFLGKAVIIAVGSSQRALGIPGEAELLGRGVSQCATCDGPLFRGQRVGVIGGGDSALQEALTLTSFASQVSVFHCERQLTAQQVYRQRALGRPDVDVHYARVEAILGETAVTGVQVRDLASGERSVVALAGVFPFVGLQPNTAFLADQLRLDPAGHIPTDVWMRTELHGLFAAGDVRQDSASQAISAAGDGATAAIAAHRYLQDRAWR